jgi:hypothetical protein
MSNISSEAIKKWSGNVSFLFSFPFTYNLGTTVVCRTELVQPALGCGVFAVSRLEGTYLGVIG